MSTVPQIRANQENAQLSTGPRTNEGKAIASENGVKHGLSSSKHRILPGEDPAAYDQLLLDLSTQHQPANPTETILVTEMANAHWKLLRSERMEFEFLEKHPNPFVEDGETPSIQLLRVNRYENSARRAFHKSLDQLRKLQTQRQKENAQLSDALDEMLLRELDKAKPKRTSQAISTEELIDDATHLKSAMEGVLNALPNEVRDVVRGQEDSSMGVSKS